jgi:SP family general alpha glucoside:H+ symporter-like MFS transporter
VTITYASEVMPVALRQYLTTYVNFCWGLGQVIGVGVVKSQLGRTDDMAWQLPYYLQLMWPPILGGLILFAPESPWWLVRHGRYEEAKKSLYRLTDTKRETDFDADQSIAMMKHTIEMEAQVSAGSGNVRNRADVGW